jgi:hypothetical protein
MGRSNVEPPERLPQSLDLRTTGIIRDHPEGHPRPPAVEAGRRGKVFMHLDGSVVLLPKLPASALRGIVKPRRPRVTIEDMA